MAGSGMLVLLCRSNFVIAHFVASILSSGPATLLLGFTFCVLGGGIFFGNGLATGILATVIPFLWFGLILIIFATVLPLCNI